MASKPGGSIASAALGAVGFALQACEPFNGPRSLVRDEYYMVKDVARYELHCPRARIDVRILGGTTGGWRPEYEFRAEGCEGHASFVCDGAIKDPRRALCELESSSYENPPRRLNLVGVPR